MNHGMFWKLSCSFASWNCLFVWGRWHGRTFDWTFEKLFLQNQKYSTEYQKLSNVTNFYQLVLKIIRIDFPIKILFSDHSLLTPHEVPIPYTYMHIAHCSKICMASHHKYLFIYRIYSIDILNCSHTCTHFCLVSL